MNRFLFLILLVFLFLISLTNAQNIIYPPDALAVIDVTKAPYNCDSTGMKDCTEALIRAMDDVLRPTLKGQRAIEQELRDDPRSDFYHHLGVENRKIKDEVIAIFPSRLSPSKILYFPDGIYRVSNTVCYTFEDLNNSRGNELNRQIIVRGQSEGGTVIRLDDNCPGFEKGAGKPVFSFMLKNQSNVAMVNMFENISISIGKGNAGAAGLRFFGNNTAAVRNVTIRSEDPGKDGHAGILCDRFNMSGCYFKNITIDGFDYGIQVLPSRMYTVFEHVKLTDQKVAGFLVDENLVSIRDLRSYNTVPGLMITGAAGQVVLIDSKFSRNKDSQGFPVSDFNENSAIEHINGLLFARNIEILGYNSAVTRFGKQILPGRNIEEYSSHGVLSLRENQPKRSLNLPVEETPDLPWEQDISQWISVSECGAKGDGVTDDTKAIQKGMKSGKRVIYFQPGRYLINGQITIPASVQRINFMFADLVAGEDLKKMSNQGTFKVDGFSEVPLIVEDLFAFEEYRGEQYLIDHASTRTLVLSDLHVQTGALYINTVQGGKVFIENICCTDQFPPDPNCYHFRGQKVWARQLNPERADPEVINDGSQFWLLGFKTESRGVGFLTKNGGTTEILGGVINIGGEANPFIVNDGASVSIVCGTSGWQDGQVFRKVVLEIRNGEERLLERDALPKRILPANTPGKYIEQFFIPLYTGY